MDPDTRDFIGDYVADRVTLKELQAFLHRHPKADESGSLASRALHVLFEMTSRQDWAEDDLVAALEALANPGRPVWASDITGETGSGFRVGHAKDLEYA